MKTIALIGPPQGGKSTLAFTFSKFLEKKGFKAGVANLGVKAKALKYEPFWDVRSRKNRKTDLLKIAKEEGFEFVFLDYSEGMDALFFSKQNPFEKTDVVLLVFEASTSSHEDAEMLSKALEERWETKTIPVENKADLAKRRFSLFPSKVISVSAWEKMGFEKLLQAVKQA